MVNLDDFKYGGTNLTAFRLLDPEREEVKQVVQDWVYGYGRKLEQHEQTIKVSFLFKKICIRFVHMSFQHHLIVQCLF